MPKPSDKTIEKELRIETKSLLENDEEVTVNKVRVLVEEKLDLPERFLKDSGDWKDRSKKIIYKAMVSHCAMPFGS
jgi:hypothetical protein